MQAINVDLDIKKLEKLQSEKVDEYFNFTKETMDMFNPMNNQIFPDISKLDIIMNDIRCDVEGIRTEIEHIYDADDRDLYFKFASASLDVREKFLSVVAEKLKEDDNYKMKRDDFFSLLKETESNFNMVFTEDLIEKTKKINVDEYMKHILSDFDKDLMAFDKIGRNYIRV